ncbi:asparagine synthase (glutamine-hydrolyzing) [Pseudomonas sp. 10B1]|uniref:asparagine synthase (glutamine-hydrolyzing) n=1 Tax=unclassified Pseudomonas TaxID=196821 RepID=UPI002B229D88|nr:MULTISPECIES: asparagine synthase (glutamine-hydrolyzing) [unclassified Pseudomonas]MEA9997370.1 asparagine synthase (glutamine-hydrolyzing) [Pseudomonas sp. AA4]MEB0089402.1 asparagine synthase (glutamine-hydrolyzing) [Pseudomonas sp. RTI1]MEB0128556.1 asparagine synthase (glutamine-hydrolyzing) [Pseudomonas sp. CCC1.2]MEB0155832.1 asparagine synthase (glutamine-hydrolyzing) [Pseudomonas sp. CCC4.3]MEB0222006.1 asparagine synthase (glutamine-hydrolyzing) [Pseudomonas sp. AB12(2023)]
MCGILGYIRGSSHESVDFSSALSFIRRRGPDDRGIWSDEDAGVWLGHVRLSILDTSSAGHQPMISPDGRVVMVFNGEIYNFRDLRDHLEVAGDTFSGQSDSEVLLALFCRYGIECLSRLNGIFAVVFWERDSSTLWVARDQMGVKPLYISSENGCFAFSSEMKGLLRGGLSRPEIDPKAVLAHLGFLWSPGDRTIVRGIRKVLPGQALCIRSGQVQREWFYYELPIQEKVTNKSIGEIAQEVVGAVKTAVQRQLVADVPLGAFLSGGLDSSAIVAFASEEIRSRGRLQCFSIRVENGSTSKEGFSDDLPYAEKVAKHLDVDLHVVGVGDEMMDRLPEMVYLLDEPTPDPAALNALFISELAHKNGIKVLLSGAGGDDIFTGYRRHFALAQERWWGSLPQFIRSALAKTSNLLPASSPLSRRLGKAFHYAGLPADDRLISYFLWLDPGQALGLLAPDLRRELTVEDLFSPLRNTLSRLDEDATPLDKMLSLECKHFLADHNLNYTDKMGMATGVEVRVPLLDLDLVKLAGTLPSGLKQKGRTGKWIFKKAMEPYLPHDVIYRPKTGFGVPLRNWLQGRLKPLVDEVLSPISLRNRGIFDADAVADLVKADRSGRIDAAYTLFGIVCMELWCKQYLDGNFALD